MKNKKSLKKYLLILASVILGMMAISFLFKPHLLEVQYYNWPFDKDFMYYR